MLYCLRVPGAPPPFLILFAFDVLAKFMMCSMVCFFEVVGLSFPNTYHDSPFHCPFACILCWTTLNCLSQYAWPSLVPRPTPFFSCSYYYIDRFPLTIIHGCFRIRVLLSTETEEQKKRSRPGNEAMHGLCIS